MGHKKLNAHQMMTFIQTFGERKEYKVTEKESGRETEGVSVRECERDGKRV